MNNYIHSGKTMEVTAPSGGLSSGQVYLEGETVGVVVNTVEADETAVMNLTGVYEVPKAAVAFTKGEKVYWDDSAGAVTTASGGNTLVGVAEATLASGITSANVRWNGSF